MKNINYFYKIESIMLLMISLVVSIQIFEFLVQHAFFVIRIKIIAKQALTFIVKRNKVSIGVFAQANLTIKFCLNWRIKVIVDHIKIFLIVTIQFDIIEKVFIAGRSEIKQKIFTSKTHKDAH